MRLGIGDRRPAVSSADAGQSASGGTSGDANQDSHLRRLLRSTYDALETGDVAQALRLADRACRQAPQSAEVASMLGRLLLLSGETSAALLPLRQAARLRPCPDYAASLIHALTLDGRSAEALEEALAALHQYAVAVDGVLARATARLMSTCAKAAPGWVGIAPDLAIVGEMSRSCAGVSVYLRNEDGSVWAQVTAESTEGGRPRFRIPPGSCELPRVLAAEALGAPLLGSPIRYPPDFSLDGRATTTDGRLSGWISLGWIPEAPIDVVIDDDAGRRLCLTTEPDPTHPGRRIFARSLADCALHGDRLWVSARLPNGQAERFPDTPLLLDVGRPIPAAVAAGPSGSEWVGRVADVPRPVDIIVPVFRGFSETLNCLRALLPLREEGVAIIVVDDASPEPELSAALQAMAATGTIRLLRNPVNRGFPASVNRGLALQPNRDAVILNSDAMVHGDWLTRLRAAVYSAPDIATATPLSNCGSIASYPSGENTVCSPEDAAMLDDLAATANRGIAVDVPVGVGFCLYVRRDCLDQVGGFDEIAFGKGYGEETDFCLRARERGWRHVVATDVFVLHLGGRSFGRQRDALLERGGRIVNRRYPGYDAMIDAFIRADPLAPARRRIDEGRLLRSPAPCALLVTLALPGGVERVVSRRRGVLSRAGLQPIVLQPESPGARRCQLIPDDLGLPNLCYDAPAELSALSALIRQLNVVHIELHHFLDLDADVIELIRALGVPYDVYIHDYSWICPRLTLLGGNYRYCGEPQVAECEICIRTHGSSLPEDLGVEELRERSRGWLTSARRVIVPCRDTLHRMQRYFPDAYLRYRPWETRVQAPSPVVARTDVLRVAVIGAIGKQKGFEVLLACAEDAAARDLPLEFVVVGYSADDDALLETGRVFVTGRYEEAEVAHLLRRERPRLALFASVWPETWCFALTHALRTGLPVVAFDIGAIAERLRDLGVGTLLPLETSPSALNDRLLQLADAERAVASEEERPGVELTEALEIDRKHEVSYGGLVMVKEHPSSSGSSQSLLAATAETLTLHQGLYLFYVRSAAPMRESTGAENVTLPAVQVGLAPGTVSENVQFIAGPRTTGTWLCEPGNMIVAKISGAPATLIITSIRKTGGQPLAIDVERLDGRGTASDDVARPAPEPAAPPVPAIAHRENGQRREPPSALPPPEWRADVRCEIVTHVQNAGDLSFVDEEWAGGSEQHLWIENFRIRPLNGIAAEDIEYKCLTVNGYETPWIAGGEECGTRQRATPLVAFALRMRSKNGTAPAYDCEYSGRFHSGAVVGPVANGTPCRSTVPNDPLEGIQIRITARKATGTRSSPALTRKPATGPRFSKLRQEGVQSRPDGRVEPAIALPDERERTDLSGRAPWQEGMAGLSPADRRLDGAGITDNTRSSDVVTSGETNKSDAIDAGVGPLSRAALMKHVLPFLSR